MNPFLIQSHVLQRYMAFWQGIFEMQRQMMTGLFDAARAAAPRMSDAGEAAVQTARSQMSDAADAVADRVEDGIETAQDMMAPTPSPAARNRLPRAGGL